MKDFLKDYLSFTKKERAGILIILILISAGMLIPFIFNRIFPEKETHILRYQSDINSFRKNSDDSPITNKAHDYNNKYYHKPTYFNDQNKNNATLFEFDPNTATVAEWIKLGIREKTAKTIEKYVLKGGHFYKPDDLSKIYGLHPHDIDRLKPFVRIALKNNRSLFQPSAPSIIHNKKNEAVVININTADSAVFSTLPGIGPSFSRRIVNFRNKLGGFYSIEQIGETYGLPDSTFQKIRSKLSVTDQEVKKIHLNTATVEELKAHPYIRYQIANSIVNYRKQHGNFNDVGELKKIMIINADVLDKLEHYLTVN